MKVGYIYDKIYLKHDTGLRHPESSKRLSAIEKEMDNLIDDLILLKPISASTEILALVHPHSHIDMIKTTHFIDSDTIVSAKSYDVAKMAVGAGVVAIDAIKIIKLIGHLQQFDHPVIIAQKIKQRDFACLIILQLQQDMHNNKVLKKYL